MRPNYQSRVATNELPRELTREEYEALLSSETLRALVDDVKNNGDWRLDSEDKDEARVAKMYHEAAVKRAKEQAPVIMYNAGFRKDGQPYKRQNAYAVPTGLVMLDLDHVGDVDDFVNNHDFTGGGLLQPCLIARSISGAGLRLVYVIPEFIYEQVEKADDILWAAQLYIAERCAFADKTWNEQTREYEYTYLDKHCTDWARCAFATPIDDAYLYDGENMFSEERRVKSEEWSSDERGESALSEELKTKSEKCSSSFTYEGIDIKDIIAEYWRQTGGEPTEGNRNVKLFNLACELRPIVGNSPEVIRSLLQDYGLPEGEVDSLIKSACGYKSTALSRTMRKVMKTLSNEVKKTEIKKAMKEMPQLPERLPKALSIHLDDTMENDIKGAICNHVIAIYGAYLSGVRYKMHNDEFKEPVVFSFVVGEPSSGKSMTKAPVDHVLKILRERNTSGDAIMREWKEEAAMLGANKDKPRKPHPCRQIIRPGMSGAALIEWLSWADGKRLVGVSEELDDLYTMASEKPSPSRARQFLKAGFDNGRWGTGRVSIDAVDAEVTLRMNLAILVQPSTLQDFCYKHYSGGAPSRLLTCAVAERKYSDAPKAIPWTDEQQAAVDGLCSKLENYEGDFFVSEIYDFYWNELNPLSKSIAKINDENPAYDHFRRRSMEMACHSAFILYLLNDCTWTEEIHDFCLWQYEMDMFTKNLYLAADYNEQIAQNSLRQSIRPKDILSLLPSEFSKEDVLSMFEKHNLSKQNAQFNIKAWVRRGKIEIVSKGHYKKIIS